MVANVSDAATRLVLRHTARAEAAGVDAVAVTRRTITLIANTSFLSITEP